MCNEFFNFFDEMTHDFPMHLNVSYSKTCDWMICIYQKGCAKDYPDAAHDDDDVVITQVQDPDKELCFAKAYVELKEWLCKYQGGY